MRELHIAYGNSSRTKKWRNVTTTWDELIEKLRTPLRTAETMDDYKYMKKTERDSA